MAEHPNVALVRRGFAAFSAGDMDTLKSLMREDVVHHVPGKSPISGDHKGHEGVLGLYGKLFEMSDGTMKVELHDAVGNDTHVLSMHRSTASRKGRSIDANEVLVFHFADGKISEIWDFWNNEAEQDAFWSA